MNKKILKISLLIMICTFTNILKFYAREKLTSEYLCLNEDHGTVKKRNLVLIKVYNVYCADSQQNANDKIGKWTNGLAKDECPDGKFKIGSSSDTIQHDKSELQTWLDNGYEQIGEDYVCCEIPEPGACEFNASTGEYKNKLGLPTTYEEWDAECVQPEPCGTKIVNGETKYYDNKLNLLSGKEEWKNICDPDPKPDPDDVCFDKDEEVGKNCKIDNPTSDVACSGEIKEDELCGVIAGTDNESYKSFSNDYCSIYCRRELKYEFEDKVKVIAGRYFRHSLSDKDEQINNLSGIIKVNYECGGQIKYNTWKKDWKIANEALIKAWNNYSYWNAIVTLAPLKITEFNEKCEKCHESCTIQESVACGTECPEGQTTILKERSYTVSGGPQSATLYDYEASTSYRSAFCSNDCSFTEAKCENFTSGVSYSSLHEYANSCSCSGYTCVLKTGEDPRPKLAAAASAYGAALTRVNTLKQQILDCNDEKNFFPKATIERDVTACGGDGTTTSGYDENTIYKQGYEVNIADEKGQSSNIQKFCNKSSSWNDFCSDCDSEFNGETCEIEELPYYVCEGEPGLGDCNNVGLSVLNAGAIMAKYDDVTYHYQSAKHYTQLFTGKVTNKTPSGNDYLEMPDNAWPVAVDRKTGPYNICYEINLTDPLRDMKGGSATCKYLVTNELNNYDCSDGYDGHECHGCSENDDSCHDGGTGEDQDRYDSMGVFYRSVDLTDLFPNSKFSPYNKEKLNQDFKRVVGFNWINKDSTINNIQTTGESIWTSEPEVTVTLTPAAIKKLKENNNVVGNYLDLSTGLECVADKLYCKNTLLSKDSSNNLFNILGTNSNGEDNLIINGDKFEANRYTKSGGDN